MKEQEYFTQILERISQKDKRAYQLDRLVNAYFIIGKRFPSCLECIKLKKETEKLFENIEKNGSVQNSRKAYELFNNISSHLPKKHKVYPVNYFTYRMVFAGLLIGGITGAIIKFIGFDSRFSLLAISIGMIIGYFLGNRKDNTARYKKDIV